MALYQMNLLRCMLPRKHHYRYILNISIIQRRRLARGYYHDSCVSWTGQSNFRLQPSWKALVEQIAQFTCAKINEFMFSGTENILECELPVGCFGGG